MQVFYIILLIPVSATWSGFVFMKLWQWFVVPFGLAPLSLAWAIGLLVTIRFLTTFPRKGDEDEEVLRVALTAAIYPAFALGSGWLFTQFM